VEQNVRRALEIADRGYVLVSGRIVKEANIEELFFRGARPRT
jgi:ABC-type branched-subunit amino acid transport system ATPase component